MASVDEFTKVALEVIESRILSAVGFTSVTESSLQSLTDVCDRYLVRVGHLAQEYVELAQRKDGNVLDALHAINELATPTDVLTQFARHQHDLTEGEEEATTIPTFPLSSSRAPPTLRITSGAGEHASSSSISAAATASSMSPSVASTTPDYVPSYLPCFPPRHSFARTEKLAVPSLDQRSLLELRSKRKRESQVSLSKLARITSASAAAATTSEAALQLDADDAASAAVPLRLSRPRAIPLPETSSILHSVHSDPQPSLVREPNMLASEDELKKRSRVEQILQRVK